MHVPVDSAQAMGPAAPRLRIDRVVGYTPSQIGSAYGFNQLARGKFSDVFDRPGEGQTIAIVTAYHAPTVQEDLDTFSARFNVPSAQVNRVFADGQPGFNSIWASEAALDVEWAHALAPYAKIVLVEAKSSSFEDIYAGVDKAVEVLAAEGGGVVSMSWGAPNESAFQRQLDAHLNNSKTGRISFVSAAPDGPALVGYPDASPYVLSVGGSTLDLSKSGSRLSPEVAWSGSGGGYSWVYPRPAFQDGVAVGTRLNAPHRAVPDVGYNADPATGFAMYTEIPDASGDYGWRSTGGNSAAAPQWAAIVALANQLRQSTGQSVLGSRLNQVLYDVGRRAQDVNFTDILRGSNGHRAQDGFDLVTGWGTPRVNRLVPSLAGFMGRNVRYEANYRPALTQPLRGSGLVHLHGTGRIEVVGQQATMRFNPASNSGGRITLDIRQVSRHGTILIGQGTARMTPETGPAVTLRVRIRAQMLANGQIHGTIQTVDSSGNIVGGSRRARVEGCF